MTSDSTKLKVVKKNINIMSSASNGTNTWWMQRVTALAMIPLSLWFVYLVIKILNSSNAELYSMAESPFNTILMMLFMGVGIYHGNIGMKEILEDYVHCERFKIVLLIILNFFSIFTILTVSCAMLVLHFSMFKL